MILEEVIGKLDRSEKNKDDSCVWDLNVFQRELDICQESVMQDKDNPRLMGYWVANTCDTDTYVGLRAYFFDDKIAAISFQSGRGSDEVFEWASKDIAYEIRKYIRSLSLDPDLNIKVIDFNENIGDGLPVHYSSDLLGDIALYNGKKVKIVNKPREYLAKVITLRHDDGTEEVVEVKDILMPWKLTE